MLVLIYGAQTRSHWPVANASLGNTRKFADFASIAGARNIIDKLIYFVARLIVLSVTLKLPSGQ